MFIPLRNLFFCVRSGINLKLYHKFVFVSCGFILTMTGFMVTRFELWITQKAMLSIHIILLEARFRIPLNLMLLTPSEVLSGKSIIPILIKASNLRMP